MAIPVTGTEIVEAASAASEQVDKRPLAFMLVIMFFMNVGLATVSWMLYNKVQELQELRLNREQEYAKEKKMDLEEKNRIIAEQHTIDNAIKSIKKK